MLALKLAIAGTLNLRSDEAYVWTWSEENALSFLDHPPMIAWFARLGTALFGQNLLGVRLPTIVALLASELLLADTVRRRTGSLVAGLSVVLMMEASIYFGVTGVSLEPSVPMILFLSLMFWGLGRLEETEDGRWWLLVGLAGGLALLSKYIALLFVPAVLMFVLVPRANRKWVLTAWPWLAVLLAIVAFSPVLIWNAQHDWASFRFQGVRVTEGAGFQPGTVRELPHGQPCCHRTDPRAGSDCRCGDRGMAGAAARRRHGPGAGSRVCHHPRLPHGALVHVDHQHHLARGDVAVRHCRHGDAARGANRALVAAAGGRRGADEPAALAGVRLPPPRQSQPDRRRQRPCGAR